MKFPSNRWAAAWVPLLLFTVGCVNPINLKTASRYYEAGAHATGAGDHYAAAVYYSRAYGNAKIGRARDAELAMTLYAYGRELALLGEFVEAIELLEESLRIQRKVEPVDTGNLIRRMSVLGRIYLDTHRPFEALDYLREALELVHGVDGLNIGPGDQMYLLRDLEKAAVAADSTAELETIREELTALLDEHGEIGPSIVYSRFTARDVRLRIAADASPSKWKPE